MEMQQSLWKGTGLITKYSSDGKKIIAMSGEKSLLYIPITAKQNSTYRITLEIGKENGNGLLFCNIYGNRNFDFPHAKIICEHQAWCQYVTDIETKTFPQTLPIVFRIWRYPGGTGSILVKKINVELIESKPIYQSKLISTQIVDFSTEKNPEPIVKNEIIEKTKTVQKEDVPIKIPQQEEQVVVANDDKTEKDIYIEPKFEYLNQASGSDIKLSVVISVYNRINFFRRTLYTYANQTMNKNNYELVVVDDSSTVDIKGLCKEYSKKYGIKFQYIKFNRDGGAIKPLTFTPALSNNIGIKLAKGDIVVITGPETLQKENNLLLSYNSINDNNNLCIYGYTYRSDLAFVRELEESDEWQKMKFSRVLDINGAKADKTINNGWWWYYLAVRKSHLLDMRGVDERFMLGISGEDDDLANRLIAKKLEMTRNHDIICIHQDHSLEDKSDSLHSWRYNNVEWRRLRSNNESLLNEWRIKKNKVITNENIDWGSFDAIIEKEEF